MRSQAFEIPRDAGEAVRLAADPEALVLAGGTAVGVLLKEGFVEADRLVWLGRVRQFMGLTERDGGGVRLGSLTTLDELARSPLVAGRHAMLAQAARAVGNPRVRSVATVGGALGHADPRQDLPPALLAAGASAVAMSEEGRRTIRLQDGFFQGFLETDLAAGELVAEVVLPDEGACLEGYERFTPASMDDYPTVAVAARVRATGGEIQLARIALGGAGPTPVLAVQAASALMGERPSPAVVEAAAGRVLDAIDPSDDERGSARYKAAMAQVVAERLLTRILLPDRTRQA